MQLFRSIALAATTFLALGHLTTAAAQTATQSEEPSSTGKGIVGGTLLGAELVLLTEAAFDVSPEWLYYVGGGAGAVGGGIAGYYLEGSGGLSPKGNMFLLAAGMLLAIPTTVAVLSATAYEQPAEYTQDQAPSDEPKAEPMLAVPPETTSPPASTSPTDTTPGAAPTPATPTSQSRSRPQEKRRSLPMALVAMDSRANLHLGLPAVEVREMYSRTELMRFGVQQRTELRVPLFRVAF
jgi:hypothetical protein